MVVSNYIINNEANMLIIAICQQSYSKMLNFTCTPPTPPVGPAAPHPLAGGKPSPAGGKGSPALHGTHHYLAQLAEHNQPFLLCRHAHMEAVNNGRLMYLSFAEQVDFLLFPLFWFQPPRRNAWPGERCLHVA